MLAFTIRKIVYNIPIYLTIVLIMMALLRVRDPVTSQMGKNFTQQDLEAKRVELGLEKPFLVQYTELLTSIFTFDFSRVG